MMLFLIICSMLFFSGQGEPCDSRQGQFRPEIFQHWVHSREEDKDGLKVFRPHDYPFPPARGRREFEIKENGEFILYRITRGDARGQVPGRWKARGKNKLVVSFSSREIKDLTIEIVSYDKDILKIKSDP